MENDCAIVTKGKKSKRDLEVDLMYCRIVGRFFHDVPSDTGLSNLVKEVGSTGGNRQKLLDLRNIGVWGSEPIRSRVVQAGALDVVGCILEAWLASKGFLASLKSGDRLEDWPGRSKDNGRKQPLWLMRFRDRFNSNNCSNNC